MFYTFRLGILLLFAAICSLSGTKWSDAKINPSVYYEDKTIYKMVSELPKESRQLIDSFYKKDHQINVKLDVISDIQNCR